MEVKRQDFRAEIGCDAEAPEVRFMGEDLGDSQSSQAVRGQVAAAEVVGVFPGEFVAKRPVSGERWHVMIHVRAALDDRGAEQVPPGEAAEGVRRGKMRRDGKTAG